MKGKMEKGVDDRVLRRMKGFFDETPESWKEFAKTPVEEICGEGLVIYHFNVRVEGMVRDVFMDSAGCVLRSHYMEGPDTGTERRATCGELKLIMGYRPSREKNNV